LPSRAQTHDILAHRTVAHLSLFEEILFEPDDIEEIALLFAVQISAKTTKCNPLFLLLLPGRFIQQHIQPGNRNFVYDFAPADQCDAVEQLMAMSAMRLAVFKVFKVAA
jgi:hypothetical protein